MHRRFYARPIRDAGLLVDGGLFRNRGWWKGDDLLSKA